MFDWAINEARSEGLSNQDNEILDKFEKKVRWSRKPFVKNQAEILDFITRIRIGPDEGAGYLRIIADGNMEHFVLLRELIAVQFGIKFRPRNDGVAVDTWRENGQHITHIGILLAEKSYLPG